MHSQRIGTVQEATGCGIKGNAWGLEEPLGVGVQAESVPGRSTDQAVININEEAHGPGERDLLAQTNLSGYNIKAPGEAINETDIFPHRTAEARKKTDNINDSVKTGQGKDAETIQKHVIHLSLERKTRTIEKRKTLLAVFVKNEKTNNLIVNVYKHKATSLTITIFWFVCIVNFLSIGFRSPLLPTYVYLPMQIFYTINFIMHHSIYIRVDILNELGKSFNFWFTMWNLISLHICYIVLWSPTIDTFCAEVHSFSSILLLILFDAHAGKQRTIMKTVAIIGIFSMIPIVVILIFRLVDFENESFYYGEGKIEIVNVRLQAVDNLTTLIIYLLRIFYNHTVANKSTTIAFLSSFYEIRGNKSSNISNQVSDIQGEKNNPGNQKNLASLVSMKEAGEHSDRKPNQLSNNSQNVPPFDRLQKKSNDNPDFNDLDPEKYMVIGVMENVTINYDLHRTVFHQFIEGKFILLERILKSKYYNAIGILGVISSLVFSLPLSCGITIGGVGDKVGIVMTIFGIGFISIQMITTCNLYLVSQMMHSFDYWYVTLLCFKTFVSAGLLCDWDTRMIFWVFEAIGFNWSIMVDTFHIKNRRLSYLNFVGSLWMLSAALICKLNFGNTFSNDRYIEFKGLQPISSRITISSSLFSSSLFAFRFFWSYHRNPQRILFMTENTKVEPIGREA